MSLDTILYLAYGVPLPEGFVKDTKDLPPDKLFKLSQGVFGSETALSYWVVRQSIRTLYDSADPCHSAAPHTLNLPKMQDTTTLDRYNVWLKAAFKQYGLSWSLSQVSWVVIEEKHKWRF